MDLSQSSKRSHLKENILATKLEGVASWIEANRPKVLTALGVSLALVLIASVLILRQKEQKDLTWTRLAQAQAYMGQKQWDGAKQILNDLKTSSRGPLVFYTYYYLAEIAINEGQTDEAIQLYSEVVSRAGKNPLAPLALSALGSAYEQKRDYSSATQTYSRFLEQYSNHFLAARLQLALGRVQLLNGDKESAKKSLGQLIDLYPNSEWAKTARQLMDKI